MSVRAKLKLTSMKQSYWNSESRVVEFFAIYDETIPEDLRFAKASPSGTFTMQIDNPLALGKLELGKDYYFDITPCENGE